MELVEQWVALNSHLNRIEGEVVQTSDSTVWVRDANSHEIALRISSPQNTFLTGHRGIFVCIDAAEGTSVLKAVNETTGRAVTIANELKPVPNFLVAGFGTMASLGFPIFCCLLVPIINALFALLVLPLALMMANRVRHGYRHVLLGLAVFIATGALLLHKATLIALMSPTVGLWVGLGLLTRQIVVDSNALTARIDAQIIGDSAIQQD